MSAYLPGITPYDDVNRVLRDFAGGICSVLGSQFVGMYVYGSLVLGDFDPAASDIDFLVVTDGELSERSFAALAEMHARFAQGRSSWANRIEAAYIPRQALNHAPPTAGRYPQVEKGTQLFRAPLEPGWAFQRYTLRERGVAVSGPPASTLIEPVEPDEMRRAAAAILDDWLERSRSDPGWLGWARERQALAFIVLTACRLLYSVESGSVASKPACAQWATQQLAPRWTPLIERALASQHARGHSSDGDVQEMLAFLAEARILVRQK